MAKSLLSSLLRCDLRQLWTDEPWLRRLLPARLARESSETKIDERVTELEPGDGA